jgi:hypothetical protein
VFTAPRLNNNDGGRQTCDGFLNKKKIRVVTPTAHITTLKGNARTFFNFRKKMGQIKNNIFET